MGETCKSCAKWEEEIYWNHFQSSSFIHHLSGDFYHHLALPKKFANNMRKELPDSVEMKGPGGAKWNVELKHNDGTLFFERGWPEFVKAHSLQENDILTFTYNRDSCFHVLMFERQNLCEKETSYFVRRCECGCSAKRKAKENPFESIQNSSHELDRRTCSGKSSNDDDSFTLSRRQHVVSQALNSKFQRKTGTKSAQTNTGSRNKGPTSGGAVIIKSGTGVNSRLHYVSNRRPVTEAERINALQLAQAALTDESFMVVLRPTQVYKGFYLVIPRKWLHTHLNPKIQLVTLRVGERTWDVKYYYNVNHVIGRLTSGWKSFAVENNLEEWDVCVFKAGSLGNNSIIVDVSIFRVVEETAPPRRVVSGSSSKRCRSVKRARKQVFNTNI